MNKLIEIAKAWVTAIDPSEEEKEKAITRSQVCDDCEKKDYNTILKYYYCKECSCPLSKKIYSPENSCPLAKWNV